MISKELLKEVLGNRSHSLKVYGINNQHFDVILNGRDFQDEKLNKHELANECKEWALTKGYEVHSNIGNNLTEKVKGYWKLCYERTGKPVKNMMYETCESEPEAIFKACQWILDNA